MIRRLAHGIATLVTFIVVIVVAASMLPVGPVIFRALLVDDRPRRADAIVVLGGGLVDDDSPSLKTTARLVHGLRLHHRGYAPIVILTGGRTGEHQIPEAVVMRRVAEELGTRPQVLVMEADADRTATQGEAVARIARARGLRSILLVTSPEHSYRAVHVFRKTGFDVVSTPVTSQQRPALNVIVHPYGIIERLAALLPLVYETGAITMYWWRGWI